MSIGTLEQLFEFELHGVEVPAAMRFHVPGLGLEGQLQSGTPLRLTVRVDGTTELAAEARAGSFAQLVYHRLLLRFGAKIERSVPPSCVHRSFATRGTTASPAVSTASDALNMHVIIRRSPVVLSAAELKALVRDVEALVVTPQPPTSAQLYTAIAMYAAGLESQNKVVRFLVFYSALALAALFKWHDGNQENVDRLVLERNPQLTISPSPKKPNVNETLYTKLRNDFIHAEDRGRDPAGAIAAIEAEINQFQHDVSLVFSNL